MSRNRARKKRQRDQRNAIEQDITLPSRRPTSSYIKRLLQTYHRTNISPLGVQQRLTEATVAALVRYLAEQQQLPEDFVHRISEELDRLNKPEIAEELEAGNEVALDQ